jgi:hypothetical protein
MTASLETLVVAAYVFADSLSIPRAGPAGKITDKELIALAVCQAAMGISSDRQFVGVIGRLLPGWFPHLPDQTQYNRRLRRLTAYITTVQLMVAELIAEGRIRLADGTLIGCANYPGCASHSHMAGHAGYGYCPSKSLFVWGVRLVLVSDIKGVPTGYQLVAAGEKEYEPVFCLAEPGSIVFADKGLWGRDYQNTIELSDRRLITPDKHRLGERPPRSSPRRAFAWSSSPSSPTSRDRCASKTTCQDPPRPGPANRPAPARAHARNTHQPAHRPPRKSARRL